MTKTDSRITRMHNTLIFYQTQLTYLDEDIKRLTERKRIFREEHRQLTLEYDRTRLAHLPVEGPLSQEEIQTIQAKHVWSLEYLLCVRRILDRKLPTMSVRDCSSPGLWFSLYENDKNRQEAVTQDLCALVPHLYPSTVIHMYSDVYEEVSISVQPYEGNKLYSFNIEIWGPNSLRSCQHPVVGIESLVEYLQCNFALSAEDT